MKRGFALPFISIVDNYSEFTTVLVVRNRLNFLAKQNVLTLKWGLNKIYSYENIGLIVIIILFKLLLIK